MNGLQRAAGKEEMFREVNNRTETHSSSVYADGIPPVIHRAYVMAYEASGRFSSIWVVSQVYYKLVPVKGQALFF